MLLEQPRDGRVGAVRPAAARPALDGELVGDVFSAAHECPRVAQVAWDVAQMHHLLAIYRCITEAMLHDIRIRFVPLLRHLRRHHARTACVARMEWFGHRTEVRAEPRGLARAD